MNSHKGVRLRQAVLVAGELTPVSAALRDELGLNEPYADPGVGAFGLHNAVYAIGDKFLEIVSPIQPDTTAGRYLERRGDGGYMVIFQFDDLDAARERASEMGIRTVWQLDLPDISGTHLHPADTKGAIVSLDRAEPRDSWRWGGPAWTEKAGDGAPGQLRGVTISLTDPENAAARWAEFLGVEPNGTRLELDETYVAFEKGGEERLTEIDVSVPGKQGETEIGGARFKLS